MLTQSSQSGWLVSSNGPNAASTARIRSAQYLRWKSSNGFVDEVASMSGGPVHCGEDLAVTAWSTRSQPFTLVDRNQVSADSTAQRCPHELIQQAVGMVVSTRQ